MVDAAAVVSRDHKLYSFVQMKPMEEASASLLDVLLEYIQHHCAEHYWPDEINEVMCMPVNRHGKWNLDLPIFCRCWKPVQGVKKVMVSFNECSNMNNTLPNLTYNVLKIISNPNCAYLAALNSNKIIRLCLF